MVLPLHDDNPTTTKPYVTVGLMIACVLVYVWQHLLLNAEAMTNMHAPLASSRRGA